jgi:hypothetical protein
MLDPMVRPKPPADRMEDFRRSHPVVNFNPSRWATIVAIIKLPSTIRTDMKLLNGILANWKTGLLGIATIATALSDGFTFSDVPAIMAGIGLIVGKDADKTNSTRPIPVAQVVPE